MTETMTLNMGSFAALSSEEMLVVDGGGILDWAMGAAGLYSGAVGVIGALGTTKLACAATCAAIAGAPVVAWTAAACGVATAIYGVYCIFS